MAQKPMRGVKWVPVEITCINGNIVGEAKFQKAKPERKPGRSKTLSGSILAGSVIADHSFVPHGEAWGFNGLNK